MRALPLLVAALALAPTAGAVVYPNVVVSLDLDVPPHWLVGTPVTFTAWVGTDQGVVSSGLPFQKVNLADNGEIVATGETDLNGIVRFTRTYDERGVHAMSAWVEFGNYVQDAFLPAHSGWPPQTIRIGEPPSAPSALVVSGGPHWDEAVLAWAVPSDDGGVPIDAYWHSLMDATGAVDASTRVVIREGVTPGEPYVASVRATNGLGPGASRSASFVAPFPPARDAIELSITHFTACWGGDCVLVAPGATITIDRSLDDVRAYGSARLVDEGAGVPDTLVRVETTMFTELSPLKRVRAITLADGSVGFESGIGYHSESPGECKLVRATASAVYPGLAAADEATFTVCFA